MDSPCEKIQNQLADYILGILSAEECENVDKHVSQCPECRQYKRTLEDENRILMQFGKDLEATMPSRFDKVIEALNRSAPAACGKAFSIWRTIMSNRIARIAVAAVMAIVLLVPLSYGTAHVIKVFVIGTVGIDNCKGTFELNKDIYVELKAGIKEQPEIVTARSIRFFKEGERLNGSLRCSVRNWPKFKWRTRVELFNARGKRIQYTEHVNENGGVKVHEHAQSFHRDIHFSLGLWRDVAQARGFKVRLERVPEETEVTCDAWVQSSELDVVHGRVVGSDGKPIANAHIQIRQKRRKGQRGIAAPDVSTDKQGCYSYDRIKWPYRVGVLVYETIPSGQGYRHQYKRLNKVLKRSRTVDFELDTFPAGRAVLSGKAEKPNGETITEFTVNVRSKVDWNDYSTEYLYQFGLRRRFITSDGKFEVAGLPAGLYDISIIPTTNEVLKQSEMVSIRNYVCELRAGESTEIKEKNAEEKAWYGRVLFEDGSPAVPNGTSIRPKPDKDAEKQASEPKRLL